MTNAESRNLFGRRMITTSESVVTPTNLLKILQDSIVVHEINRNEMNYLYEYYKGKQPILDRTKTVRPEINNTVVENRANEIVSFKVGYLMGEPIQYVSRGGDSTKADSLNALNEYMFAEDKPSKDKELADWFTICGTSYRMILPDRYITGSMDDSPFEVYTLDPRNTFVVYSSTYTHKPLMGVYFVTKDDGSRIYSIYTEDKYYESDGLKILSIQSNYLREIPIIEYPANNARLGAFEIVLPLLDSINTVASNRLDAVEQFVQAFLVFKGVDIDSEDFAALRQEGGLKVPTDGDVKYLVSELNQTSNQTLVDYMYQTVLTICGMPNRNGGSSTSDTGSAVIMRDGWSSAEARAKDTELMFKLSEKAFLRLALKIANEQNQLGLKLSDIEIRFTRRNYENVLEKSQVLTSMLANDKIHPKLAFEHSGLFTDPTLAYMESRDYYEENLKEQEEELNRMYGIDRISAEGNVDVRENRQDNQLSE